MFNSWLDSKLNRTSLQNEIKALVAIRHPCITTIMGATVIKLQGQKRLCLVVELMELGSLWDLLHNETFILRGKQVNYFCTSNRIYMYQITINTPLYVLGVWPFTA